MAKIKFESKTFHPNGCTIKHMKNRSVIVNKLSEKSDTVVIEFRRADFKDKEELNKTPMVSTVKWKARATGVTISKTAALALYSCLHDYFTRVEPI